MDGLRRSMNGACASITSIIFGSLGCKIELEADGAFPILHALRMTSDSPVLELRNAAVAFAIRNGILGHLPCLQQGVNDHLMSLHLPLRREKFATIIIAYAPYDEL
ncbi:unnamed protein product [Schistocephalus solidus]|uniref:RNase H domain-containing protein n=1 Tax=Schistocephalus solidus TaxID=70667 RepID=A0A183T1B6_SCHSO|nr:unnamed protein product [Schistocephalus solidus]